MFQVTKRKFIKRLLQVQKDIRQFWFVIETNRYSDITGTVNMISEGQKGPKVSRNAKKMKQTKIEIELRNHLILKGIISTCKFLIPKEPIMGQIL